MSEAYSEAPDVEGARLLLDFGDDYRNFLDSQSDCASSMSAVRGNSPPPQKTRQRRVSVGCTLLFRDNTFLLSINSFEFICT